MIAASAAVTTPANAANLLYRNDFTSGTDYLGAAINASSFTVTSANKDLSAFNLSNYDVVVYANQGDVFSGGDLSQLNAYVAAGGKVIFDDWTQTSAFNGGEFYTGNNNLRTLTLGSQFGAGIVGPFALDSQSYGTFSTGLGLAGGSIAGTFENGEAAMVVGNGGRTIVNGFLSDTVASQRLYANELASFGGAVPEPGIWAMMLVGFGLVGASLRGSRRRQALTA